MQIIDKLLSLWPKKPAPPLIDGVLPQVIHPVVIVPGFLGNWPPQPAPRGKLDPLTYVYTNLYELLCRVGYVPGVSLFGFCYDWRRGLDYLGAELGREIERISAMSSPANSPVKIEYGKVDIIAHSFGGLVSRTYIQNDNFKDNVARLYFVATPQRGTTAAYYAVESGDSSGIGIPMNVASNMIFIANLHDSRNPLTWGNGLVTLLRKKVAIDLLQTFGSMASVHDLLPLGSDKYLFSRTDGTDKIYPFGTEPGYPPNPTLERLSQPASLEKLEGLEEIVYFYSTSQSTQYRVLVETHSGPDWPHGRAVTPQPAECYTPGDSVVPAISATLDFNLYHANGSLSQVRQREIEVNKVLERPINHVEIVGEPAAARLIVNTLLNSQLAAPDWDGLSLNKRKLNVRALFI